MFKPAVVTFLVAGVIGCGFEPPPPTVLPEVFFAVDQSLTDESIASTQLLLKLSLRSPEPVTVRYAVTGGTAMVGRDLNNAEGEVTFEAFQDTAVITLAIVDDGLEEDEESVKVTLLKDPKNAKLGPQIDHTLRISANKLPRVRFVAAASAAGEATGVQTFAVQLDTLSPVDVVVRYSWAGSAEPGDHGVVDGFVTIRAGQLSQPLLAPIINDPTDEDDETIDLALIAQIGAVIAPGLGQHVHTIVDDDPPPAVLFSAATSAASEGTATATVEVRLALASEKPITVQYAGAGGGTASPDDFTINAGTLAFDPGTTTLTVPVTIASDALDEDDETVRAQLMNPTNATLGVDSLHTLSITDDDNPPTIEFQQGSSTAAEGTATHSIGVKLSAPSGKTIQFSISRGGTSTTDDLTLPATTFTIPPGATTLSFDATVIDDAVDDNSETAVLTLEGLVNVTAGGARQTHTVTITDNDVSVRFDPAVGDKSGNERNTQTSTHTYKVRLSEASTSTVTVNITLGGTASDDDYDIGTGDIPVVFSPGQTTRDLDVIIRPDFTDEPDETITLTIGSITNGTPASDNQTRTHTILDDDN